MDLSEDFKERLLEPVDELFNDASKSVEPPPKGRNWEPPGLIGECLPEGVAPVRKSAKPDRTKALKWDEDAYQEAIKELETMIGLEAVKTSIKRLADYERIEMERRKLKLPPTKLNLHMVFEGNPGTGKTTVARLIGKIFRALGLLSSGHVQEVSKANLVGAFLGETPKLVEAAFKKAEDGILFLDEAYSLTEAGDDLYGKEAIGMIVKLMEDMRSRVVVIVAGYPDKMKGFIDSNPGLRSRFSRRIFFSDYSAEHLHQILQWMCKKGGFDVTPGFLFRSEMFWQELYSSRLSAEGNGRIVRNVFEVLIENQAARLSRLKKRERTDLTTLLPEDWDGLQHKIESNLK